MAVSIEADRAAHTEDHALLQRMVQTIERLFVGKREAVELTVVAMLAQGHVLFEDVPGVGKTTLARAVAHALGCGFKRIQFTSDLLPADIVGVSVYDRDKARFSFRPGPVFTNLLLADEINRTTPRTQSALLEAMNEQQVTVDDTTHPLPRPFMVLATQNPLEFAGTYPLPESQLDRFLVRVTIGYPAPEVERAIIRSLGYRDVAETVQPVLDAADVVAMQDRVTRVRTSEPVLDYLQRLIAETRESTYLALGISTRAAIALYRACQARAYLHGRDHVVPDDVKALFLPVCAHRAAVKSFHDGAVERRLEAENVLREILDGTPLTL
ncbi:MAG: MoxR family ATPase [Deltaproteobacteria bacterium]|nr:MoxR family ATPase [Deltaproteobacteria bacterium]MCB9786473.1 MoxR family ATPase [Deltaproteobacteria bacterium]